MIGQAIAAEAESWVGTPFIWQGRVKGVGCDCKGLLAGVAKACGRPEANSIEATCGDYGEVVPLVRLRWGLHLLFDRVTTPAPGDVLLIRTSGKPQHLAIFAPRGPSGGLRVIEAMHRGVMQVRPFRRRLDEVDSIWRWRDG